MHYVEDKLGGDSLMQRLNQTQDGATDQLVEGLTSKASGVFLWVRALLTSTLVPNSNREKVLRL